MEYKKALRIAKFLLEGKAYLELIEMAEKSQLPNDPEGDSKLLIAVALLLPPKCPSTTVAIGAIESLWGKSAGDGLIHLGLAVYHFMQNSEVTPAVGTMVEASVNSLALACVQKGEFEE